MQNQLGDKKSKRLLSGLKSAFQKHEVFFALRRHISFVCGGNVRTSLRRKFQTFVKNKKPDLNIFLAESAVSNLLSHSNQEFLNLSEFENLIGSVFDSILIFPESPGSMAELGYFSCSATLQKKVLVVNETKYQGDSFIYLGPTATINEKSDYRPAIYISSKNTDFHIVINRLLRYQNNQKRRIRFEYKKYTALSTEEKFAATLEIIGLVRGISLDGLFECFNYVFRGCIEREIKHYISILDSAGFIVRHGVNFDYFSTKLDAQTLLNIDGFSKDQFKARALEHYKKHYPEAYSSVVNG